MENRKHYLITKNSIIEKGGSLVALECMRDIPFEIKRVFFEYAVGNGMARGEHANKKSKFCMFSASGSCEVCVDDGIEKTTYKLDSPNKILYLDNMLWKTMNNFSIDCVLVVLSDSHYDKDEYIRDYNEYINFCSR